MCIIIFKLNCKAGKIGLWVIISSSLTVFELQGVRVWDSGNAILCSMRKKQMNKKFFFQQIILIFAVR